MHDAVSRRLHYFSPLLEPRGIGVGSEHGVFARKPIPAGEVLAVWGGNVVTEEVFCATDPWTRRYMVQVEEGLFLTPSAPLEPAEFFNHSCLPNAGMCGQITLVAMRRIGAGEEVRYDYAMTDSHPLSDFECRCGAPRCRGRLSFEDWRRPELQARYSGFFSSYLQRRIDLAARERTVRAKRRG